jgi:DNA-directed RNA polymerase subunit RPC12/RpoP
VNGKRGDEYTCASCGGVYKREQDDEAALAEWNTADPHKEFTGDDLDGGQLEIVCHDCWLTIMGRAKAAGFPVPDTFEG